MKLTALLAVILLSQPLVFGQDTTTTRSVTGQKQAAHAAVVINQIDTSAYPRVTIFATVLRDGAPVRGLGAADFKVREDEVQQEPLTVVPKLTPLSAVLALDTSGSMKKRLPDAQAAAKSFIDSLAAEDKVSVLAFARDVRTLNPGGDRAAARAAIDATVARGDTALYDALYGAIDALKATPGRKAIALLSDGADDNGSGRPLSRHTLDEALALARVVNVPVFAIGVGSEIDEPVLKRIGAETGAACLLAPQPSELKALYAKISEQLAGQYNIHYTSNLPGDGSAHRVQLKSGDATGTKEYQSPVKPAAVLAQKAPPATPAPALIKKENSIYGEAIRGGDSYEKAVPLKPGQLYHLDHHQRKNEFDYFVIEAKPGHKLIATINTTQKGVSINGDKVTPNEDPYAGIAIHGPQRTNIVRDDVSGRAGSKSVSTWIGEGKGGKYYVLVGSIYDAQNSEENFRVELAGQFDAGTEADAGSTEESALEIKPGVYPDNHLTYQVDDLDTFKFRAKAGVAYQVKARAGNESSMKIQAFDADGVKLAEGQSPNGGAVGKIEKISIAKDGWVFLKVSADFQFHVPELTYSLALGEGDVDSPPRPKAAP